MTTQERIEIYHKLVLSNPEAATKFVEENREDQLFVSLVELQQKLVAALVNRIDTVCSVAAEKDDSLRAALTESLIEDIMDEIEGPRNDIQS